MIDPENIVIMIRHNQGYTCAPCWNSLPRPDRVELFLSDPDGRLEVIPAIPVKNDTTDSLVCDQCLTAANRLTTNQEPSDEL